MSNFPWIARPLPPSSPPPPPPPFLGQTVEHQPPPPPTIISPFYPWFFLTISFICSSFALIFFEPVFTSSDSWLARSRWNAVVLKDLEPKQNMGKCLLCERRLAEMLLSVERWDPRNPTLDKKAAGTAYLSFGGKYLNLKHFLRAEFRRSAWHIEQAPAMFLSFLVTNPSATSTEQWGDSVLKQTANMASPGGILTRIRSFMQQPTMKKAVKTIFPDPMDKFKWQDVLWDFRSKEALEEWTLVTDEQFGGKSTAEFVQSPGGRAIFKGHISTELPPASDVKYTGMCSIRAQPKWVSYTPPPPPPPPRHLPPPGDVWIPG